MRNILITGYTGKLAAYLRPLLSIREDLNITGVGIEDWNFIYPDHIPDGEYDLIVHMGAYTNVLGAETERQLCFDTNVNGTWNLVEKFRSTPFIYISTEWAYNPLGIYALTKQLGEEIVKNHPRHLILRTLFKPTPWPFDFAYEDQITQGDYVDVIAKKLVDVIDNWNQQSSGIQFLGTGRKTILDLARETKPDVQANTVDEYNQQIGMNIVPKDYL